METSKKTYQEPDVTKVEFDFNEAIAFSVCLYSGPDEDVQIGGICFE